MNPTQQQVVLRYPIKKTSTKYIPVEDGFVTSAGNPDLAAKYGNNLGANSIISKGIIESVKEKPKS